MSSNNDVFVVFTHDSALAARACVMLREAGAACVRAETFSDLLMLSAGRNVRGAIVDDAAFASSCVQGIARLRQKAPMLDILLVASELRGDLFNDLQPLRVRIVARPIPEQAISLFVTRCTGAGRVHSRSLAASIDQLASEHRLNGHEVSLLGVVLDSETAEQAQERLGIDGEAYLRTMRRLLRKCHARTAERLATSVLREAVLASPQLA